MLYDSYKVGFLNVINGFEITETTNMNSVDIVITSNVLLPRKQEVDNDDKLDNKRSGTYIIGKTLLIDLDRREEEIFHDIHKNAKYKIKRATNRDPIQHHEFDSPSDTQLKDFTSLYNDFAKHKEIQPANLQRLQTFRDQNSLILSYITDENQNILCSHIHHTVNNYCCLYLSASARFETSQDRNLIGRANRFLHWQDIKQAKAKGYKWYDFGGLSIDESNIPFQKISRFKMEFGGQVVDTLTRVYGLSPLGKTVAYLYKIKAKKRPGYTSPNTLPSHLGYSN